MEKYVVEGRKGSDICQGQTQENRKGRAEFDDVLSEASWNVETISESNSEPWASSGYAWPSSPQDCS